MNNFCRHLKVSLSERFNIAADVYVSKKKRKFHMSLVKPLLSYNFHEEVIDFFKSCQEKEKLFFPGYFFIYLN